MNSSRLYLNRFLSRLGNYCTYSTANNLNELNNGPIPSKEFMQKVINRKLQGKLSKLIAEIQVMQEFTHEVPKSLTENQWNFLLDIRDFVEREAFIRQVYFDEINKTQKMQSNDVLNYEKGKIMEEKKRRFEAGEIVYGRGFYDYIDIRGRDFRKMVDRMHGSRLVCQETIGEKMPQLIFDCRYLQKNSEKNISAYISFIKTVNDYNWFEPNPFRISIVNLLMDDFLAKQVRQKWHFALGTPQNDAIMQETEFDLAEFEDLEDIMPVREPETKHILAPKVTSRGIRNVLDSEIKNDEVAFISNNASRHLDDDISRFKAFVICTTDDRTDRPLISSTTAAAHDGFKCYKLPIEKYVKWERGQQDFSFARIAKILKDVYLKKFGWKEAFLEHIPNWHFLPAEEVPPERLEILEIKQAREKRIDLIKAAVDDLHYRKMAPLMLNSEFQKRKERKPRIHKYSREERNRRKAAATN